jgi:hypothetical protein
MDGAQASRPSAGQINALAEALVAGAGLGSADFDFFDGRF